jgi:hypothetical protein
VFDALNPDFYTRSNAGCAVGVGSDPHPEAVCFFFDRREFGQIVLAMIWVSATTGRGHYLYEVCARFYLLGDSLPDLTESTGNSANTVLRAVSAFGGDP